MFRSLLPQSFVLTRLTLLASLALTACGEDELSDIAFPEVVGLPTAADDNPDPNIVEVSLPAQVTQRVLDGRVVECYTYNGLVPGPIIQAAVGQEIIVHFKNNTFS